MVEGSCVAVMVETKGLMGGGGLMNGRGGLDGLQRGVKRIYKKMNKNL